MLDFTYLNSTTLKNQPHPYRARGRRMRDGWCAAAARAFTGAELYLDKRFPTLAKTATASGSNVGYVRAALVLIKDGTQMMREAVLAGRVPLLVAANRVHRRRKAERITVDDAVAAWRTWTPEQRADFGQGVGVAEVWDGAISPAVTNPSVISLVPEVVS